MSLKESVLFLLYLKVNENVLDKLINSDMTY